MNNNYNEASLYNDVLGATFRQKYWNIGEKPDIKRFFVTEAISLGLFWIFSWLAKNYMFAFIDWLLDEFLNKAIYFIPFQAVAAPTVERMAWFNLQTIPAITQSPWTVLT